MGLDLSPLAATPGSAAGSDGRALPARAGRWTGPGAVLAWASVGPALLVAGWLVAVYPLAYAGRATPVLAPLAAVPVVALVLAAARRLPAVPGATWGPVLGTLAIAAAFAGYTLAHSAGHVVLRRDPGVYALLARWIADSGGLLVPARLDLIGTPDGVVTATAQGLYQAGGDDLSAQFMSGTALTLAPAGWGGGWGAILSVPALVGCCGILAVAGLAARLLGPRWAPPAAAALALTQPMLLTARSTYSEPLAQLLLLAGACLLLDAVRRRSRPLAALAGLLIGLNLLIRIDALRELALVVVVVAWLALRRHPGWWPLALGTLAGAAYGVVDAYGPAQPYLADLLERIRPVAAALLGLAVVAAVAVPVAQRLTPWLLSRSWWPEARTAAAGLAAAGVAGVLGWLLVRPLVWEGRGTFAARTFIETLQREQGLRIDGHRNYAEQSVRWTSWYVGWPALALAAVAAVLLTWRALRGDREAGWWALGLGLPLGSALSVLDNPAITPDHPWADRRLVPTVLPVVLLLALWSVATLTRSLRPAPDAESPGAESPGRVAGASRGPRRRVAGRQDGGRGAGGAATGGDRGRGGRPAARAGAGRARLPAAAGHPDRGRRAGGGRPRLRRVRPGRRGAAGGRAGPAGVDRGAAGGLRGRRLRPARAGDRPYGDSRRGGRRGRPGAGRRPSPGAGRAVGRADAPAHRPPRPPGRRPRHGGAPAPAAAVAAGSHPAVHRAVAGRARLRCATSGRRKDQKSHEPPATPAGWRRARVPSRRSRWWSPPG